MPPKASTFAESIDGVYYLTLWLCAIFFVLIAGVLLYSIVKWRRKTPDQPAASTFTHNTPLEVVWTVIPLIIMMVLFAWGWKGSMDMTVAPADALLYQAKGRQWEWQIWHPNAPSPTINEMWVPVNTSVKVTTYSEDVLHSFYVPAFRCKRDVLPGRYQMVWFEATREGTYPLMCAEYCGRNHSYMLGKIHVVSREEYDKKPWDLHPEDPVEWGKWLVERRCTACHSVDGSIVVGPSFKGVWGKNEQFADGSTNVVDEAYVLESIREPQAKIVKGFEGQAMTPFPDLRDDEIGAIIEYFKSIQ